MVAGDANVVAAAGKLKERTKKIPGDMFVYLNLGGSTD
jgi:hypothetical protein